MPGPYDAIPEGKKAVLVDGNWSLVDLDKSKHDDAVILLAEALVKIAKLEESNKAGRDEIERLKIQVIEAQKEHKVTPKGK